MPANADEVAGGAGSPVTTGLASMSADTSPTAWAARPARCPIPIRQLSSNSFSSLYGGVQGGYNYVLPSRLLLGVEADITFPNFQKYRMA